MTQVDGRHGNAEDCVIDRRHLFARCVGGSIAAVVAGLLGVSRSESGPLQGQSASAVRPQLTADRLRLVSTGINDQRRSIVMSDEMVPAADIWRTSAAHPLGPAAAVAATPVLPTTVPQIEPMPGGTRFFIAAIPPSTDPKPTLENRRGFHRTQTLDYIFLLSGEVTLLLDEQETLLKAGDCTILRNVSHSWRNNADSPCQLLVAMIKVAS